MTQRLIPLLLSGFLLSACDTLDFGYVNKLDHPITIVEHSWDPPQPVTLKPGGIDPPGFGHIPESIDILSPAGRLLAHYRTRDLPKIGPRNGFEYVVITSSGAVIERQRGSRYQP